MTSNPDRPTVETLLAHSDFVRGLARTLVSDPATADDAVQQAWLAAVEHPPADARSPRGWLATVTRNAVRKSKRGAGRRDVREQAVARPEGSVPSAAAIAEREEARRKLVDAVLGLDEPYRSAIVLRYLEECPPREVAARLDVPVETARTRIKRGLEQLRGVLDTTFAGRTAWGLALIPLAVTGGTANAAAGAGAGVGLGLAAAAALLLGSVVALGFVLAGGTDHDGALGGDGARDGIAQAPGRNGAVAGGEAGARPPLPEGIEVPPGATPEEIAKALATPLGGDPAAGAGAVNAEADADAAVPAGALALHASARRAVVPHGRPVMLYADFRNIGGANLNLFTPQHLQLSPFPRWRLTHEDGRVFKPAARMAQTMRGRGLEGTLQPIAVGEGWRHVLVGQSFHELGAKGKAKDANNPATLPPGRYRVNCSHAQESNKLPHAGPGWGSTYKAVPGVWTGTLTAPEFWIEIGETTTPQLKLSKPVAFFSERGALMNLEVSNPSRHPVRLSNHLSLSLSAKIVGAFTATVPVSALRVLGDDTFDPETPEVPAGGTLAFELELRKAGFVRRGAKAGAAEASLFELLPRGMGHLAVGWPLADASAPESALSHGLWITVPALQAKPEGFECRVESVGGSRVRVRVANNSDTAARICNRLSWPREVRLSIVDAGAPKKAHASTTRSGGLDDSFPKSWPRVDLDKISTGLSWNGNAYEKPGALKSSDFQVLEPGASITRELDLADCVWNGLPAGTYTVHAVWRSLVTGEHLGLEPAVLASLQSAPIEIVVE